MHRIWGHRWHQTISVTCMPGPQNTTEALSSMFELFDKPFKMYAQHTSECERTTIQAQPARDRTADNWSSRLSPGHTWFQAQAGPESNRKGESVRLQVSRRLLNSTAEPPPIDIHLYQRFGDLLSPPNREIGFDSVVRACTRACAL